jgi:hypothetical protein
MTTNPSQEADLSATTSEQTVGFGHRYYGKPISIVPDGYLLFVAKGKWRPSVLSQIHRELRRRGLPYREALAEPHGQSEPSIQSEPLA